MNVYEKLAEARLKIAEKGMKKNGKNSFAGYTYFELSDILPAVNAVNNELKLLSVFSFADKVATLCIINGEKPEEVITFEFAYSPDGASLKGCHKVQNDGAVQTCVKRYLYQNAYEIAEGDALDSTMNPNDVTKNVSKPKQKKPFSDVIADLMKTNKNAVLFVLGENGFEKAEDVPQNLQPKVYSDIMNKINNK
jgi:predicted CopG family antitoxin